MPEKPEYMQREYWEYFNRAMGLPSIYPNRRYPTGPEKGFCWSNKEEVSACEESEYTILPEIRGRRPR